LFHDGIPREYIIFFPEKYDNNIKIPLILNFHGGSGIASPPQYFSNIQSLINK
jgi:Dipeptidyl aminopeptidases/acylaminoacyl-peptidases